MKPWSMRILSGVEEGGVLVGEGGGAMVGSVRWERVEGRCGDVVVSLKGEVRLMWAFLVCVECPPRSAAGFLKAWH